MSAWQPIENAPRDRRILVVDEYDRVDIVYYVKGYKDGWWEIWEHEPFWEEVKNPRFWMPLPDPPIAKP